MPFFFFFVLLLMLFLSLTSKRVSKGELHAQVEARPGIAWQGCPAAQLAAPLLSPVMWLLLPLPSTRFLLLEGAKTNSWGWGGILPWECCIRSELLGRRSESPRGHRRKETMARMVFFPLPLYIFLQWIGIYYMFMLCVMWDAVARKPIRKGQIPRDEQVVRNVEEWQIGRKTTEMWKDRNVNPLQPSWSAKIGQTRPKIPGEPILLCILAILPLTWL